MMATGAFKGLKAAIAAGRDIQDMTGQLANWGKAFSDFTNLEERQKNPPFWQKTFKNKKKMESMRKEIKDHISWHYGPSAWEEVLQIEAQMRKIRKEELYKKQERIDNLINWTVGLVIFAAGASVLTLIFYLIGKSQGRW
jgi:hypothetical protein